MSHESLLGETSQLNRVRTGPKNTSTVVLIHAVGLDLTYWDRQIDALQSVYDVVAFDLPGHGRSPGKPEDWSFDAAAEMTSRLIESAAAGPVHLVGISFGSMIAQATVLAKPDLVRSLTLIGTAAAFPASVSAGMRARAEAIRKDGMKAVLRSSLERWFTPRTMAQRPDLMDRVTKTILADDPAVQAAIWDIIADLDFHDQLGRIKCPTLVLVGEHDPSTPPSVAAELTKAIPNAKLVVLADTSHMATVESHEAVNTELLQFLAAN